MSNDQDKQEKLTSYYRELLSEENSRKDKVFDRSVEKSIYILLFLYSIAVTFVSIGVYQAWLDPCIKAEICTLKGFKEPGLTK